MAMKLSTSIMFGAVLCIIATLLYLDMYASDTIINSQNSQSPVRYIYKSTGRNRYHTPIQSLKLHRNLLLQIDEAKDYSRFLSTENTTRKYLKQPRRKLDVKDTNSSFKIDSKNMVNSTEQKVVHKVNHNSTSNEELVFDYEYTYDYASESISSQGHSNGNSWLYRIAPFVKDQKKQEELKLQKQNNELAELEKIEKITAHEDRNKETRENFSNKAAEISKYTNSQKVEFLKPVQRTNNVNKLHQSDNLMEKVVLFMNTKNLSESNLRKPQDIANDIVRDSKNVVLPNLNLTDIKQRYIKANRTDISEELYRLAPELFDQIPPSKTFSTEFKSPCWHRGTDKNLQCLPYFYLAGMPKCGTTDMWAKINSHKGVYGTRKEPHWWARQRIDSLGLNWKSVQTDITTFQDYVNRYVIKADSKRVYLPNTDIAGDGSASTFWDNHAWESFYPEFYFDGPPYVTGDIIHAITPRVKIIILLRNPVDRLYSSYQYFFKRKAPSPLKFQALVEDGILNYKQCLQKRSFRACVYSLSGDFHKDKLGLTRGIYDVFLQDWLRSFSKDQIMAVRLEDWAKHCNTMLPQIFQFLGLDPLRESSISTLCSLKRARNSSPTIGGKMLAKTRLQLNKFYMPHLLNLAEILGDGKFLW